MNLCQKNECILILKKQEEEDLERLRTELLQTPPRDLDLLDNQTSARVLGALTYKEKSALRQKVKEGCIKQESGMGTRQVDKMSKMYIEAIGFVEGWQVSYNSPEGRADSWYQNILERQRWGGLAFPNATLFTLFEQLTMIFHGIFKSGHEQNEDMEQLPRFLKSILDQAVNLDLITAMGLIEEASESENVDSLERRAVRASEVALITIDSILQRWFNTMMHSYEETLKQSAKRKILPSIGAIPSLRSSLKTQQKTEIK